MAKNKSAKKKKSKNEKDKSSEIAGKMASVIGGDTASDKDSPAGGATFKEYVPPQKKDVERKLKEDAENSQESKEEPETKEKDLSKCRPEGAPDAEDCQGECESEQFYIYKIKPESVHKYKGKKKILIEK